MLAKLTSISLAIHTCRVFPSRCGVNISASGIREDSLEEKKIPRCLIKNYLTGSKT